MRYLPAGNLITPQEAWERNKALGLGPFGLGFREVYSHPKPKKQKAKGKGRRRSTADFRVFF